MSFTRVLHSRPIMRTRLLPVAAAAVLLTLTACTASAAPQPEPTESYAPAPVDETTDEAVVPNEIEPDAVLIVRATATADNGAVLSLEYQVHQSVRWDDVPGQTLPAALVEDCPILTPAVFADGKWSFTRTNLTAIPADGSAEWPSTGIVGVLPSAAAVYSSGRGVLASEAASGVPLCETPKTISTAGRGGLAVGIPGDADIFTAWAGQRFGFTALAGVALSECSVELTPLGSSLGGGFGWAPISTADDCSSGATTEAQRY